MKTWIDKVSCLVGTGIEVHNYYSVGHELAEHNIQSSNTQTVKNNDFLFVLFGHELDEHNI